MRWWIFHSWWCLRFGLGHGEADDWKYFVNDFQYHVFVGCICMLNHWFSSNDEVCAVNYIFFRFTLQACVAVSSGRCICTALFGEIIVWVGLCPCGVWSSAC